MGKIKDSVYRDIIKELRDEVQKKEEQLDFLDGKNLEMKYLLKDIKLFFEECNPHDFTVVADNMDFYLSRINATIGESEE